MREKYILRTNFNESWESEDRERSKIFEKKLELLCLEYGVDINYD